MLYEDMISYDWEPLAATVAMYASLAQEEPHGAVVSQDYVIVGQFCLCRTTALFKEAIIWQAVDAKAFGHAGPYTLAIAA